MARSFFITRASTNSDDPTALEFFPPKGSDELHEALKEAFPFETNLAARMRAAVIEFLLQEQQVDQFAPISPEYLPSPQSSFISTMPSPALTSSRTSQDASQSRRQSAAAGQPTQEALMDVWSLPNKPQAKIHTRRTMTDEEKKAYKQKRLIGACADCKRRRRKCDHTSSPSGVSPVSQKVGKHKKRAPAATLASKLDAVVDFSWNEPTFNFDNDFTSMPMPEMGSFDTSFELDTAEFEFTPDLSADWQLFPDLPNNNNGYATMSPRWSPDHSSTFAPQTGLSQQQVSPGTESMDGFLNQNMLSQGVLNSGLTDTGLYGTITPGNAPLSPMTPESLSPVSRTQSNGNLHTRTDLDATANNFSAGATIEQSRVSLGKPVQVPLTAAPSTSPLSPRGSLNKFSSPRNTGIPGRVSASAPDINPFNDSTDYAPMSAPTCRWAHLVKSTSNVSEKVGDAAQTTNIDPAKQGVPDSGKDVSRHSQERQSYQDVYRRRDYRDHSEALSLIEVLLPAGDKLQSPKTTLSPSTSRSLASSTTSRPSSNLSEEQSRLVLVSDGLTMSARPQQTPQLEASATETRPLDSPSAGKIEGSSRPTKNSTSRARLRKDVSHTPRLTCEDISRHDMSLAQVSLCGALCTAYSATNNLSNAFAFTASLLVGIVLILVSLGSIGGTAALSSKAASQALRSMSGLTVLANCPSTTMPQRQSATKLGGHQSNPSVSLKRSWASRLGLLTASVMV